MLVTFISSAVPAVITRLTKETLADPIITVWSEGVEPTEIVSDPAPIVIVLPMAVPEA